MLLAVLVYGAFAAWSGYAEVRAVLATFSWPAMLAACCLAIGNYLLRFAKWEYYLAVLGIRGVPRSDSLLIFLSGFVLTITPGKLGEVFKSVLLLQTHQVPIARTAPIVVAERLTDLVGITLLITMGLRGLSFPGARSWAAVGFGLITVGLLAIMSRRFSEAVLRVLERLPGRLGRIGPKVRESWESLRLMTTPRTLVLPALLSVVAWALEGLALHVVLRGFGAFMPAANAVFFYSTATLAGAVVPVPGGLGVTEGALSGQLMVLGHVPQAAATASMILVRFATLWLAVAVGFIALGLLRLRYPALRGAPEGQSP
jgi:glycosyltransferase 2 family protein